MSNPNPQYGRQKYSSLTMNDRKTKLPWPQLPGFMGAPGRTESKRINVDPKLSRRELLQQYLRTMKEHEKKKFMEKQNVKSEDEQLVTNLRENMILDAYLRAAAENKKRDDFLHHNGSAKERHAQEKNQQLLQSKLEKYDYFPFTHGYEIERKQKEMNKKRKEEMNKTFHNHKPTASDGASESSSRVPMAFYADYPIFLKPHKHYPYRRMKDGHVEDVMNDALQRYEKKLVSLEEQKKKDAREFKEQLIEATRKDHEKEEIGRQMRLDNQDIILKQMRLERERKKLDREDKKELVRTNFGPEENDETQGAQNQKKQHQVGTIKDELLNQIVEKQAKKRAELERDRIAEVERKKLQPQS